MGIIYLDLETTGTESDNSIAEISASYFKDGAKIDSFSEKCHCKDSVVNLDALKINKTKFSELDSRRTEKEILLKFFDWMLGIKDSDLEMVGVNPQFDFNFLKNRAKVYNIELGSVVPYRLTDLGQYARLLVQLGLLEIKKSGKGNTLLDMAKALKIDVDSTQLHSAAADVALYEKVHAAILDLFKKSMCLCPPKEKVDNG